MLQLYCSTGLSEDGLNCLNRHVCQSCRERQKVHPFAVLWFAYSRISRFDEVVAHKNPMPNSQLPNYLQANRKRLGLSQRDMSFLLGAGSGSMMSRYEGFTRQPSLEIALALEVICKRSVSELFGGLYQKAEKKVTKRAQVLLGRDGAKPQGQSTGRRTTLSDLACL